jgi:triosephosphate isomerase
MRKPIIAGNWKMQKTIDESVRMVSELKSLVVDVTDVEMVVCPTNLALASVASELKDSTVGVGAQNMHYKDGGAFTGEVSADMIQAVGATYVILGHSERRQLFGEDNCSINKKIHKAIEKGLIPLVCVGEQLEDRESGNTEAVVKDHIEGTLAGLTLEQMKTVVIAYEPIWAIGTGKTASPEQAQEVHAFIRSLLTSLFNDEVAQGIRIQYGGSVKPENAAELMGQSDIDGALVGGASLNADSFAGIIKYSRS